jgi:hypothetical protein
LTRTVMTGEVCQSRRPGTNDVGLSSGTGPTSERERQAAAHVVGCQTWVDSDAVVAASTWVAFGGPEHRNPSPQGAPPCRRNAFRTCAEPANGIELRRNTRKPNRGRAKRDRGEGGGCCRLQRIVSRLLPFSVPADAGLTVVLPTTANCSIDRSWDRFY